MCQKTQPLYGPSYISAATKFVFTFFFMALLSDADSVPLDSQEYRNLDTHGWLHALLHAFLQRQQCLTLKDNRA